MGRAASVVCVLLVGHVCLAGLVLARPAGARLDAAAAEAGQRGAGTGLLQGQKSSEGRSWLLTFAKESYRQLMVKVATKVWAEG